MIWLLFLILAEVNVYFNKSVDTTYCDTFPPDTGHFSRSKNTDPSWHFIINGDTCDLYFSPSPMPEPEESSQVAILNAVKTADHSIYFCIYIFTRQPLCDTMKKKWESGDTVRGVFDRGWWNYHYMYTCSKPYDMRGDSVLDNDSLITNPWTPTAYVYADSVESNGKLHHKYMIIDAEYPNSDPIGITGSQNWSKSGCYSNDENILIIHSPFVANQYLQHFVARYTGKNFSNYQSPVTNYQSGVGWERCI